VVGLGVINEANKVIKKLLGSDFGEDLVAVHGAGFQEVEAKSLNDRALVVDLPLDGLNDLGAVKLVGVDHGTYPEIDAPIRSLHGFKRGLVDHLGLRRGSLQHFLDLAADHSPHLGPTRLEPLPQLRQLQALHGLIMPFLLVLGTLEWMWRVKR